MRKIAIVGAAPSSNMLAPYKDDSWEIWGLNFAWRWQPRIDRLFEIHSKAFLMRTDHAKPVQGEHWEWLKKQDAGYPIIMQQAYDEVKNSQAFPLQAVRDKFQTSYYTNSISYMLALAALEGCDEVGLWGVDMSQSHQVGVENEYSWQRPSCEYFCGVLVGQGVKLHIAPESDLMKTRQLYGYGIETGDMQKKMKARHEELQARIDQIDAEFQATQDHVEKFRQQKSIERAALVGALEESRYGRQWIPEGGEHGND